MSTVAIADSILTKAEQLTHKTRAATIGPPTKGTP